ncbi:MAG: S-layer homology domain-containing protein [Candidatus Gracilibacteria bacterium]
MFRLQKRILALSKPFLKVLLTFLLIAAPLANAATVGTVTPGSTTYPEPNIRKIDQFTATGAAEDYWASAIDSTNGYLYLGNYSNGGITKVKLSDFSYAGFLQTDDYSLIDAKIDSTNGYAYFLSYMSPTKLTKVRLSDFSVVSVLTLAAGEDNGSSLVIDETTQTALIGTDSYPAKVIKVDLAAMTETSVYTLGGGEDAIQSGTYDAATGQAYFVTSTYPVSQMIKVSMSDPTQRTTLPLNVVSATATTPVYNGYIYVGDGNSSPGFIERIRLSDFTTDGTLSLNAGEEYLWSATIDSVNGKAYFTTFENANNVIKIDLATFTREGSITQTAGSVYGATFDPTTEKVYLAVYDDPGIVVKIDSPTFSIDGSLTMPTAEDTSLNVLTVPSINAVFTITGNNPYKVIRINKDTLAREAEYAFPNNVWISIGDALTYDSFNNKLYVSTINPFGGFSPGSIYRLNADTLALEANLVLDQSVDAQQGYITSDGTTGYFITNAVASRIYKIDLASFTITSSTVLGGVYANASRIEVDPANNVAYTSVRDLGISQNKILKIDLSTMSVVSEITMTASESGFGSLGLRMDTTRNKLYVGTFGNPGTITAIDTTTFTRGSNLVFNAGENTARTFSIAPDRGFGYVATVVSGSSKIIKFDLDTLTRIGTYTSTFSDQIMDMNYSSDDGMLYAPTYSFPGVIHKLTTSYKGLTLGTKITLASPATSVNNLKFYSHSASGNVRLGLYSLAGNLLWDSGTIANTAGGDLITAPISSGTPSTLALAAGDYYLAFQIDDIASIPSYTLGGASSGIWAAAPTFGAFASSISAGTQSTENFTMNMLFNVYPIITETGGSTDVTEGGAADIFTIELSTAPTSDVTVSFTANGGLETSTPSVTFTTSNWNSPQVVEVSIPNDLTAGINRTATIDYTVSSLDTDYDGAATPSTTVNITDAGAAVVNALPTAPTNPFSNSQTATAQTGNASPSSITSTPVVFSSVFNDTNIGDTSSAYRIQIATDNAFTSIVQDTGAGGTAMTATAIGARSPDLSVLGFTPTSGTTYYWRIAFFDAVGQGAFSASSSFQYTAPVAVPAPSFSGGGGGYTSTVPTTVNANINAPTVNSNTNSVHSAPDENTNTNNTTTSPNTQTNSNSTTNNTAPRDADINISQPAPLLSRDRLGKLLHLPSSIDPTQNICTASSATARFTDISNDTLRDFVVALQLKGVAFDTEMGSFRPADKLSRSEMLRIVVQGSCEIFAQTVVKTAPFPDVLISHKDALYITLAKMRHIISGYLTDGTYKPDNNISRAEALKIILEVVLGDGTNTFSGAARPYKDIAWDDAQSWYNKYVSYAFEKGIIGPSTDETFHPNDLASREDIIWMFASTIKYRQQQ